MTAGDECSAELASVSRKPSPLKQDRHETIIAITEKWERERGMPILKSHMKKNQQACKIQTILQKFCKKLLAPLKNVVRVKVVKNKHIKHLHNYNSRETRV